MPNPPNDAGTHKSAGHRVKPPQGRYWIVTLPYAKWSVPEDLGTWCAEKRVTWIQGQQEKGKENDYHHWQVVLCTNQKVRRQAVRRIFDEEGHCELTKSAAANDYCWKNETAVEGTKFKFGEIVFNPADGACWKKVKEQAMHGDIEAVDPEIYIKHYHTLKAIAKDHMKARDMVRKTFVWWGPTGTGKSRKARELAGPDAFFKIPSTKWWDGYQGHEDVVIDEFVGKIAIEYFLTWFDRYACSVEVKGSAVPLNAKRFYITSNIDPRDWFPDATQFQKDALMRRLTITYCPMQLYVEKPPTQDVDSDGTLSDGGFPESVRMAPHISIHNGHLDLNGTATDWISANSEGDVWFKCKDC